MAALIFGNWRPWGVLGGALLFGYPFGIGLSDLDGAASHSLILVNAIGLGAVAVWAVTRGKRSDAILAAVLRRGGCRSGISPPTRCPDVVISVLPFVIVLLVSDLLRSTVAAARGRRPPLSQGRALNRSQQFDAYDEAFLDDPYPTYARLRAETPVFFDETWDLTFFTRHAHVAGILKDRRFGRDVRSVVPFDELDPQVARRTYPPHLPEWTKYIRGSFIDLEPPRHTRIRRLVQWAFTRRGIGELPPAADDNCRQDCRGGSWQRSEWMRSPNLRLRSR